MDIHADTVKDITLTPKVKKGAGSAFSFNKVAFGDDSIYENSRKVVSDDDIAGSVVLEKVTVQPAKASLQNNLSKDVEFLTNESTKKVVFEGTYTAKKGDVTLKSFKIVKKAGTPAVANPDTISLSLYIDGQEVSNFEAKNAGATEDATNEEVFSNIQVEAGKVVKVKVEAEVEVANAANYEYTLYLYGEDENGNDAGRGYADLLKIKALESGTVNLTTTAKDTVLLKGTNTSVAKFVVKPSNNVEGLMLDTLDLNAELTPGGAVSDTDLTVKVDGEEIDVKAAGTDLEYEVNKELPVEGLVVEVIYKPAKNGDLVVTVENVNGKGQNRTFTKKFVDALVTIAKQENVGKAETRYTFSVEKFNGDEQVTDLKLFVGGDQKGTTLTTVVDGEILEVANESSVKYINKITYKVGGADVEIQKEKLDMAKPTFRDYFRVGDTFAKIFKAE